MLYGFMDANAVGSYIGNSLLLCPAGFLVTGYQGRAYTGGIDFLDVSIPNSRS